MNSRNLSQPPAADLPEDPGRETGGAAERVTQFGRHLRPGFALIELLAVVLIIGILAAVALPVYNRAVERSRAAKMLASVRTLNEAQQRYYMANGVFAKSFEELDINFGHAVPAASSYMQSCAKGAALLPASAEAVRDGGDYEIAIGSTYGNVYSVAYRKNRCAAIFALSRPYQGLQDMSAVYCLSGDYVWDRKDWCSQTFGTDPSRHRVNVDFTGAVVQIPF